MFIGSTAFIDAVKKVNEAINTYIGSVIELGTALGMELFSYAKEIKISVESIMERVDELSLSTGNSFPNSAI